MWYICAQACAQAVGAMKTVKIGNKIISLERARSLIERIFHLRQSGSTQQEVASLLGVERSFISHLEGLGEIRRSKQIALLGCGIRNASEIQEMGRDLGLDYIQLFGSKASVEELLGALAWVQGADFIVFIGQDSEIALFEKVINKKILGIPTSGDSRLVDTEKLREILKDLAEKRTRRAYRLMRRARGESSELG